jgi:hypothetical protein
MKTMMAGLVLAATMCGCGREPTIEPGPVVLRTDWDVHIEEETSILSLVESNGLLSGRMITRDGGTNIAHDIQGTRVGNAAEFVYDSDDFGEPLEMRHYIFTGDFTNGHWAGNLNG